MADFGIYTKNVDIAARAGIDVNATSITIAETDKYVLDVEALINSLTRFNWSDAVTSGLNADVEGVLREASACLCAVYAVGTDFTGTGSRTRIEFEDRINVLRDRALFAIAILRDKKTQKFMREA